MSLIVRTLVPPTSVSHAVRIIGSDDAPYLIVAKHVRLEVYAVEDDGIRIIAEEQIYGKVCDMQELHGHVLILTESLKFALLRYDADLQRLICVQSGDAAEAAGRHLDCPSLKIEPNRRFVVIHVYQSVMQLFPIISKDETTNGSAKGKSKKSSSGQNKVANISLGEPHLLRIDEIEMRGFEFIAAQGSRARAQDNVSHLVVCFLDAQQQTCAKHYTIERHNNKYELCRSKYAKDMLQNRPCETVICALPSTLPGAFVCCGSYITILTAKDPADTTFFNTTTHSLPATCGEIVGAVHVNGMRWIVCDLVGNAFLLTLSNQHNATSGRQNVKIALQRIGQISIPSKQALVYFEESAQLFGGSHLGESGFYKCVSDANDTSLPASDGFLRPLCTLNNIAPLTDLLCVDLEGTGQTQLVACGGAFASGSIKLVTTGVGVAEVTSIEMEGCMGVFAVSTIPQSRNTDLLVLSFLTETRTLRLEAAEIQEVEIVDFVYSTSTVAVFPIGDGAFAQITPHEIRFFGPQNTFKHKIEFEQGEIRLAEAAGPCVLFATSQKNVCALEKQHITKRRRFENEISAITLSLDAKMCAVSFWNSSTISVLTFPEFETVAEHMLEASNVLVRSMTFTGDATATSSYPLLVSLGDGRLLTVTASQNDHKHQSVRRISNTGAKLLRLRSTMSKDDSATAEDDGNEYRREESPKRIRIDGRQKDERLKANDNKHPLVFACSDKPALIEQSAASSERLKIDYVNHGRINHLAQFCSDEFNDAFVFATPDRLVLATLDALQRRHFASFHIGETARRISYLPTVQAYVVLTMANNQTNAADKCDKVRLYSKNFQLLDTWKLQKEEIVLSLSRVSFGETSVSAEYFAIGTNIEEESRKEEESDEGPTSGRVLIFSVTKRDGYDLKLVTERIENGGVFAVCAVDKFLAITVNNRISINGLVRNAEEVDEEDQRSASLVQIAGITTGTLALYMQTVRGQNKNNSYLLIGDMVKSATLLNFEQTSSAENKLSEVCRDMGAAFVTAIQAIDENSYIVGEADNNLLLLRRDPSPNATSGGDASGRMQTAGQWHLGEQINAIARGTLGAHAAAGGDELGAAALLNIHGGNESYVAATATGGIYQLTMFASDETNEDSMAAVSALHELHNNLSTRARCVAGLSHTGWRKFNCRNRKSGASFGIVDGDLVSSFLRLSKSEMHSVLGSTAAASKGETPDTASSSPTVAHQILPRVWLSATTPQNVAEAEEENREHIVRFIEELDSLFS